MPKIKSEPQTNLKITEEFKKEAPETSSVIYADGNNKNIPTEKTGSIESDNILKNI